MPPPRLPAVDLTWPHSVRRQVRCVRGICRADRPLAGDRTGTAPGGRLTRGRPSGRPPWRLPCGTAAGHLSSVTRHVRSPVRPGCAPVTARSTAPVPGVVAGDAGTVAAGGLAPLLAGVLLHEVAHAARRGAGAQSFRVGSGEEGDGVPGERGGDQVGRA